MNRTTILKLTGQDKNPVYVMDSAICSFSEVENGTCIKLLDGNSITVKELPGSIQSMLVRAGYYASEE